SAHVLLHDEHAARRLDVEAPRVEADALADQRDHRSAGGAPRAVPPEVDEPRGPVAGAADRMDHREALGEEIVADDARYAGTVTLGELAGGILQLLRPQVAGRRVDEIAPEPHPFR